MKKHIESISDAIAAFVCRRLTSLLLISAIVVTLFLFFTPVGNPHKVEFNQNYIEEIQNEIQSDVCSRSEIFNSDSDRFTLKNFNRLLQMAASNYFDRLNGFFNGRNQYEIDPAKIETVFSYVWSQIRPSAVVYPTEMYYYYRIPELELAGNLRFSNIKNGELSFAFYRTDDSESFDSNRDYKVFDEKDGLKIENLSESRVDITYEGKSVTFHLPTIHTDRPRNMKLLPEEEIIAKIRDESATLFYLIFNGETDSFYYVLDEESPLTEILTQADKDIWLGERTQFAYFQDEKRNRKILIGVSTDNIMQNNYFDGPFDQVPPNLEIREKLYKAYPYTQYLNGLDPNGNFLDWKGSRVAISAYTDYPHPDITPLRNVVDKCSQNLEPSIFWSCLTYETKKDFHKTIPEFFYSDGRKK